MAEDDERIELLRTHDPLRAQMIRELLEAEGIAVSTPGLEHRAMLGVIGGYVEIVIQVPRRDRERAQEALDALEAPPLEGLDLRDDDDEPRRERAAVGYRDDAREPSTLVTGKRRRVAVFLALVLPGGGLLYVEQWRSAGIIALVQVLAFALSTMGMPLAMLFVLLAKLADALGATWHCARLAGRSSTSARRFAPEIVATLAVLWIALMVGPGAEWAAGPRSTLLCTALAECDGVDRRLCLWDASARNVEAALPRSCEECVEGAECSELYECVTCFE